VKYEQAYDPLFDFSRHNGRDRTVKVDREINSGHDPECIMDVENVVTKFRPTSPETAALAQNGSLCTFVAVN